ncbi:MAG: hypothetical protein WCG47_15275 [Dermatophilaceae bacterium]
MSASFLTHKEAAWNPGRFNVTPENTLSRVVGAVFMLDAIAFVAIVTAAITSSFVERGAPRAGR